MWSFCSRSHALPETQMLKRPVEPKYKPLLSQFQRLPLQMFHPSSKHAKILFVPIYDTAFSCALHIASWMYSTSGFHVQFTDCIQTQPTENFNLFNTHSLIQSFSTLQSTFSSFTFILPESTHSIHQLHSAPHTAMLPKQ